MLKYSKHFLYWKTNWKLTIALVIVFIFSFPASNFAKTSKSDSLKRFEIQAQLKSQHQDNDHANLASSYIQKSILEKNSNKDTSIYFESIRNAVLHARKTNDLNLEFYCLLTLKQAQYRTTVLHQKTTALDTALKTMLAENVIEDSLRFKTHQLWGNMYVKHNYHILALNEYLISQNLAYDLKDDSKIVDNLIRLLLIYDIIKDDISFLETQALIESYMPENDTDLKLRYYLKLRSFESRFAQEESEFYLRTALELSKSSKKFDFPLKKQLAIYYILNHKADSALSTIKYLETKYLNGQPIGYFHASIHIEELYARYYFNQGNFKEAEKHYASALAYCDEMEAPNLKRHLLLLMLNITKGLDDYELAFEALKSLKLLEDSTINRSQLLEYQKLKNQLHNEQVSKKISSLEFNKKISALSIENKNKNILWLASSTIALLAVLLFFVYRFNQKRIRSKELQALNDLKDFVFSVISHDLRSPLYNFNTLLSMAENKYIKEEEYSKHLKSIKNELIGITSVTESLLRWAKSNQGLLKIHLSEFSLLDVLAEVRDIFKPDLIERNIHVISNFIYDIKVTTDKDLFSFIIRNLIQNAIKFSENGSQIEINASYKDDKFTIDVVDHGVGMNKEQLENFNNRISNPKNDLSGVKSTGLGLIMARDFAHRLNIEVDAKSEVGKGTSVILSFYSQLVL